MPFRERDHVATWLTPLALLLACQGGEGVALRAKPTLAPAPPELDAGSCTPPAPTIAPAWPESVSDPALLSASHRYFAIRVLDQATRAPIAGARLTTTNQVVYLTDNLGQVAFYEPGLMGEQVYFSVQRAGYELAADGLGQRGRVLRCDEGQSAEILLTRSGEPSELDGGDEATRALQTPVPSPAACFGVQAIDRETKRGIPLVFVRGADREFVTDSQGWAALCEPSLLGRTLALGITSHGYDYAAGELTVDAQPGARTRIELTRRNLAQRLYRSTGQGIYRDSILLGLRTPLAAPLLNARVIAQDAVAVVPFRGRLLWIWGFTDRPDYPLGNFGNTGALSDPFGAGGLDPLLGVDARYFTTADGNARPLSDAIPPTPLPTWLSSLFTVVDARGETQVLGIYSKPDAQLAIQASGVVQFDSERELLTTTGSPFPLQNYVLPSGQPLHVQHGASDYIYFGSPVRVLATAEAAADPSQYEVFSAFTEQASNAVVRDTAGAISYAFRKGALESTPRRLSAAGVPPEQVLAGQLRDVETGSALQTNGAGGQAWLKRSQRFARVMQQVGGSSSFLGEVWYAEADTPMGPWIYARKILSHDRYGFAGPYIHGEHDTAAGPVLLFEGSYTDALAGASFPRTARYHRNQLVYALPLDEPRLALPVAIYERTEGSRPEYQTKPQLRAPLPAMTPSFYAPERQSPGTQAVFWSAPACAERTLTLSPTPTTPPLFWAIAPDEPTRSSQLIPLYRRVQEGAVTLDRAPVDESHDVFAYVWPSPIQVPLPVGDFLAGLQANAGPDQCAAETQPNAGVDITLDGSAISTQPATALTYRWTAWPSGCVLAATPKHTLRLLRGIHSFGFEVADAQANTSRDHVTIEVR